MVGDLILAGQVEQDGHAVGEGRTCWRAGGGGPPSWGFMQSPFLNLPDHALSCFLSFQTRKPGFRTRMGLAQGTQALEAELRVSLRLTDKLLLPPG